MSKLKPCPFCGYKTIKRWPMDGGKWESPVCLHCGATIHENFDTPKDTEAMMKAWNRRAPDPEKQELVEAMRAVLEDGRTECETAIHYGDDCVEKGVQHPCPVCRALALLRRHEEEK